MAALQRSVRGRFLSITVPLIFLSVAGVFGAIEFMAHRNAVARLERTTEALLRTQSAALANPLWNIDDEQIGLSLEAIAANRQILLARVYGEEGELMSQAGVEAAPGDDAFTMRRDIVFDAGTGPRPIGELEFVVSPREIWEQTRARLLLAGGIALVAVAMEVGAALFALRRIVGIPLERLLGAITAARSGRTRRRVPPGASDEMGQVIAAFNQMLDQQDIFERELQEQARMEGELKIGRDMQMSMVPRDFDVLAQGRPVTLWGALEPAREVGGDFYDAFPGSGNTLCLCIGDVSDKGVPAALLMAVTKTLVKAFAADGADPRTIVTAVNEELCRGEHRNMFVTLFVASLDLDTGRLTSCNAGHNPPLRLAPDGAITALDARNGPVVGAMPDIAYTESETLLAPGETLFLYTDGVTEAADADDTFFSEDGLRALLAENAGRNARALTEAVVRAVSAHEAGTERTDDITVLAVTYDGAPRVLWQGEAPAESAALGQLGDRMAEALDGQPDALVGKARIVLDEIGSNLVNHAIPEAGATPRIEVSVAEADGGLAMMVADTGPAFDPDAAAAPDTAQPLEARRVGGLGLHLVRELSDRLDYAREGDRNVYRITLG